MTVDHVRLTLLIFYLNKAIDAGCRIAIKEVWDQIEKGEVIQWLKHRVPDFDASLWLYPGAGFPSWYDERLRRYLPTNTWGVKNNGLNLLLAMTNEIIQQGDDVDFDCK